MEHWNIPTKMGFGIEDVTGNWIEDVTGNWIVDVTGNWIEDVTGSWIVDATGNWIEDRALMIFFCYHSKNTPSKIAFKASKKLKA